VLGLNPTASLEAAVSARPRHRLPRPQRRPVLVLDPVAAFLPLDPLVGLDAAFLALDADPVLGLDPVPAFLTLDPVPSLSRSLPFLGPFPFSVSSQIICFSICSWHGFSVPSVNGCVMITVTFY
jgi:hypothetical protein